jgi:hypothetical protein
MTADIVATPKSQTPLQMSLANAIGLSRDCAYPDFATIIGDSRLPFVALRLLFQKFLPPFFYCPNLECWKNTNMRRLFAYSSSRILSASPNVGRNTLLFITPPPH